MGSAVFGDADGVGILTDSLTADAQPHFAQSSGSHVRIGSDQADKPPLST